MARHVIVLSVAALRERDVARMPQLERLTAGGQMAPLVPTFPCVTCPVQANMTTGTLPREHGVVANGFYWRDQARIEMWTSPNDCILRPQIWDRLGQSNSQLTSAVWFALHSKGSSADYVCTPAPIHGPDGSESLWCYTRPEGWYETLMERLGHFPLQHFWGPMAGIQSTTWIVESAIETARAFQPRLFYIYLPHLDYAAQRTGPDSPQAEAAAGELDQALGRLAEGMADALGEDLVWVVAGEYAITPVDRVVYPNRILREAGLLAVRETDQGLVLDPKASRAWALADHQLAHVFVAEHDPQLIKQVKELFAGQAGIAEVVSAGRLADYGLDHPRSGDVVLVSAPDRWLAYYYWLSHDEAPRFARTVDIHRKPGYDPVELFWDPASRAIPLDTSLVKGSHGAPAVSRDQQSVILVSRGGLLPPGPVKDTDVFDIMLRCCKALT
ncbi:MAG TPA: alkaline phosphatase family protein [Planctomycetaceae bacterium]|nr:alkaline phosphatase family protein [Planctomycetaceae bacterium]HIQ19632.1 alkaline phosphatase family protein [Planctomycetota bacterium]